MTAANRGFRIVIQAPPARDIALFSFRVKVRQRHERHATAGPGNDSNDSSGKDSKDSPATIWVESFLW